MSLAPHETRLRVRYAETDQMGVVYHANYLVWMEVGRVEFFRAGGLSYRDFERQTGLLMAVAEAHCRYAAPARYDDPVVVKTWLGEAHPRMIRIEYEIRHADEDREFATGFTKHVFLTAGGMRPAKLPPEFHVLFGIGAA